MVQTVKNTLRWKRRGPIPCNTVQNTPVDNVHQLNSPAESLNNRKFRTTLPTAQRTLLTGIGINQVKESIHERQTETTGAVLQSLRRRTITIATWRLTHPPVRLAFKTWQLGTVQGQTWAFRSYRGKSRATGTVYQRTRSQLKSDTASATMRTQKGH